jgi:hypothetical protein
MDQVKESFQNDFLNQVMKNFANLYGRAGRRELDVHAVGVRD